MGPTSVILGKFPIMVTKQSVWGGWSGVATGVRRSRVPLVNINTNMTIRVRHDNLTITYLTYPTHLTFKCELFQTFQNNIRKKNNVIVRNNYSEPNKATLAGWVNKEMEKNIVQNNQSDFRATRIWPTNPMAIDNKIKPNKVYTSTSTNILFENNVENLDETLDDN